MGGEPSRDARLRKTLEQLRILREQSAERSAVELQRRRVEDRIREERHDAFAKTICAGRLAELPRYRSDIELRSEREALQRRWETKREPARRKR